MPRIGLLASAVFVIVSFLLGRSGDGEILIAILAWPSSLVTALICDRAETLCDIRKVPFLLVVVFGGLLQRVESALKHDACAVTRRSTPSRRSSGPGWGWRRGPT